MNDGRGQRRRVSIHKPPPQGPSNAGMALLVAIPWLMFLTIVLVFSLFYHHHWAVVWSLVIGWNVMSTFFLILNARARVGGAWYLFLGVLCVFACIWGTLGGLYNYYTHMFQYWSYDENRSYMNVLPSEPAAAHADAGKIVFTDTARIDNTRAVGYKVGTTYCVAPILDDSQLNKVEYWAAGIDCCPMRGDFHCDDAENPKARSGVVVLESNELIVSRKDMYMKAVQTATAQFSLVSAKEPVFVRWVADPQAFQDDFWRSGIGFILAVTGIYLLLSIIAAAIYQVNAKRSAQQDDTAAQG